MPRLLPGRRPEEGVQFWIAPHVKGPKVLKALTPELEEALEKLDNGEKLPPLLVSPQGYVIGTLENLWTWEVLLASMTSVYAVEVVPLAPEQEQDVLNLIYDINDREELAGLEPRHRARERREVVLPTRNFFTQANANTLALDIEAPLPEEDEDEDEDEEDDPEPPFDPPEEF